MDKTSTRQIIIISILLIALYAVIHTDDFDGKISKLFDKKDQAKETQQNINTSYTFEVTTPFQKEKASSSDNETKIKHNKGFISEKINGVTFSKQMDEIDSYVKVLQDSKDEKELISAAEKVKTIDVHKYYVPYRDSVAEALEEKANKISNDELEYDIIIWCNNTLVDLYDTLEACFINSGIEYTRSEDTHITYRYYYTRPN
ncbi:unknown [Firmicutes bacterium CAG:882]|nr:unknown [Firmicutes bacterium CAG:882]